MSITRSISTLIVILVLSPAIVPAASAASELKVFPREDKKMTDPQTGAELLFLTTAPSKETNLYFHERSWLADESLILFNSDRKDGGLMGYITATGELVRLAELGSATAAALDNHIYGIRKDKVIELSLEVKKSEDPSKRSTVTATERVICELPKGVHTTALNASCDGKQLACGFGGGEAASSGVYVMDIAGGTVRTLCEVPKEIGYAGHIQWSRTNPNLLSFAGIVQRLWVVDVRDGVPKNPYAHRKDELVTHESWWVDDQMLFCGGVHTKPQEDSHVKILNITTGQVRIIGEGSWWPGATASELAKRNWWHAAGSADGKWVAADNWHGGIMLFEGKTTRPHLLTSGHRTYGKGEHPHVGWDRMGKQVIFASHLLVDANICVATIPAEMQKANE
ncbi:MAG: hypothetical protein HZB26_16065 [Candidatus Hydrogenedentes bacterium]|nr:hypothetical protein [Candidatus Hydrogenedentota bacterium]